MNDPTDTPPTMHRVRLEYIDQGGVVLEVFMFDRPDTLAPEEPPAPDMEDTTP